MPKPVHRLLVKIDPSYYDRTHGEVSFQLLQEGTEFQRMPKHGTLEGNIEGSGIPDGATVYFVHYAVKNRFKDGDDWYVPVEPHDILGYEEDGEIKGYAYIVTKRIRTKEWEKNEESIIKMPFVKEWEDMAYEVTHNPTELDCDKGDKVWILKDRDYSLEHMRDVRYVEPQHIVYNETKDKVSDGFVLCKNFDSEDQYEQINGIFLPKKLTHASNEFEVVRGTDKLSEGDIIIARFSQSVKIPVFQDCVVLKENNIKVCLS